MKWDEEVDVICTGPGVGFLASAIAAVDAGLKVFVAGCGGDSSSCAAAVTVAPGAERLRRGFGVGVQDAETNAYFEQMSADLRPLQGRRDVDVPVRVVLGSPPAGIGRTEPFVGSRLRDWAARCLSSPYGVLFSRAARPQMTKMRTTKGEWIEVSVVGSFEHEAGAVPGSALSDWLSAQARSRQIEVCPTSALQRIVFNDGQPVGAVVATAEGRHAVRARRWVSVAIGGAPVVASAAIGARSAPQTTQVCIVGQTASRFGRVELLTTEMPPAAAASSCRPMTRRLHVDMHATRTEHLRVPGCREPHGYPPAGK
jgi:hypothetical protein